MTRRTHIKRTIYKPLAHSGSGVIAGPMVTRGNAWIVDLLPS